MNFMGGKKKIAPRLAGLILGSTEVREHYHEPFLGGASSLAALAPHFLRASATEIDADLVAYWCAALAGWVPPIITREMYAEMKAGGGSPELRGWAAHGVSYRGKRWGGFAAKDFQKSLISSRRIVSALRGMDLTLTQGDYSSWEPPDEPCVVFCDPPYRDTTGYGVDFSWNEFAQWARDLPPQCVVYGIGTGPPPAWATLIATLSVRSDMANKPNRDEYLWAR